MTKPDKIKDDKYVDKIYSLISSDSKPRPTIKSIVISDLHLDPQYKTGAPTKCPFISCCKEIEGYTPDSNDPGAGKWGQYGSSCDTPTITFESMLEFIVS